MDGKNRKIKAGFSLILSKVLNTVINILGDMLTMEQEQVFLPSRKEVHHQPKSDYSQWFRYVLLFSFTVMIAGFIYWGYGQNERLTQEGRLQPGVDTNEPSDSPPSPPSETSSESADPGLPPIDLSNSGENTTDVSNKNDGDSSSSKETEPPNQSSSSSDNDGTAISPTVDPSFSGNYHLVQPGETLYSIAMKYFSDKSYVNRIAHLNELEDQTKIFVGYKLKLPKKTP
jgi:LysM repeat protein